MRQQANKTLEILALSLVICIMLQMEWKQKASESYYVVTDHLLYIANNQFEYSPNTY